jgi:hypothetical protein
LPKQKLDGLYAVLKSRLHRYNSEEISSILSSLNEDRVTALAESLASYITTNLPKAINRRKKLPDYRTNPYVLLTSANVMRLSDLQQFASFLFNNKLYAGLETSFGKSIEAAFVKHYPLKARAEAHWEDSREKIAESAKLKGLSNEEKARRRVGSIWREIDKSCVLGKRRFLVSIKSGPNCINDTQVAAMVAAIAAHHQTWLRQTKKSYPQVTSIDVVIGLTYGTDRTTNNKENQILTKLQEHGFEEENRKTKPGVLIDSSRKVRVYRCIGQDFWAFIGNPANPSTASFVFLEVLLALARALSQGMKNASLEDKVNLKLAQLSNVFRGMMFPRSSLPHWIREDFSESELFWLATAMTAFFDEGI